MLYSNIFPKGDDDEEEDGERRRLLEKVLGGDSWGEVEEVAEKGRNLVPQFPGEPLFTVPPSYWTQVAECPCPCPCP